MFRCFFPDEYLESAYAVNYEKLYQEGVRGLLFDIQISMEQKERESVIFL